MKFDWQKFAAKLWPALLAALLAALGVPAVTQVAGCGRGPIPPTDKGPPPPPPAPEPEPSADPIQAVGKLVMQGGYCSATVVDPPRPDGRRTIVSAWHCVKRGPGERCTFFARDGSGSYPCTVIAVDRDADVSLLVTDGPAPGLPWVRVAKSTPPVGTEVKHGGYGFDRPANVEVGRVTAAPDHNGQVRYRLNVSNGDSGGGICHTAAGELLSPVCCSAGIARLSDVWGGSPERIRRVMGNPTEFMGELQPIPMPPPPTAAPKVMPAKE